MMLRRKSAVRQIAGARDERRTDPVHRHVEQQIFRRELAPVIRDRSLPRGLLVGGQRGGGKFLEWTGERSERWHVAAAPCFGEQHVMQVGPERTVKTERQLFGDQFSRPLG